MQDFLTIFKKDKGAPDWAVRFKCFWFYTLLYGKKFINTIAIFFIKLLLKCFFFVCIINTLFIYALPSSSGQDIRFSFW